MKILVLATKSPWPPVDGGRQLLAATLATLAGRGNQLTLVHPLPPGERAAPPPPDAGGEGRLRSIPVPVLRRGRLGSWLSAQLRRRPLTLHRHDHPEVAARVGRLLAEEPFDLVHAEQVQALAGAAPAFARGLPVVLRAQNVESELWRGLAARRWWLWPLLRLEARRLARAEGEAVRRAAVTVALTFRDRAQLAALAQGGRVVEIAAPAPAELPAGPPLPGAPALVLFGGGAWPPNADGARFFLEKVWPHLAAEFPAARLHLFGDPGARGERVEGHPAPAESRDAFAPGGILLVPLFIGSGVRMKILEAWARGLPVIATGVAARGLAATPGVELELAEDAAGFAAALRRLLAPGGAAAAVAAGRKLLRRRHDPELLAGQLEEVYRAALSGQPLQEEP